MAASAKVKLTQTHKRCPGFGKIKLSSDLDGSKFRACLVAAAKLLRKRGWEHNPGRKGPGRRAAAARRGAEGTLSMSDGRRAVS